MVSETVKSSVQKDLSFISKILMSHSWNQVIIVILPNWNTVFYWARWCNCSPTVRNEKGQISSDIKSLAVLQKASIRSCYWENQVKFMSTVCWLLFVWLHWFSHHYVSCKLWVFRYYLSFRTPCFSAIFFQAQSIAQYWQFQWIDSSTFQKW